jgi:sugar lactone lactonase YvrE
MCANLGTAIVSVNDASNRLATSGVDTPVETISPRRGAPMRHRSRATLAFALVAGVTAALLAPAGPAAAQSSAAHRGDLFPSVFALPDGFQPEGIAIGRLPFAFFGSRANGAIYRANLVTGRGEIINPGPGTGSLGMKVDARARLFVAGAAGGDGRVINAITGATIASYDFTDATPTFVNDVVLTRSAAWFTDSRQPVLYGLPFGRRGALPDQDEVIRLPLSGDIVWNPEVNNANGIARTPDGKALLIVQSSTGFLFRVDPRTGVTTRVDLGDDLLTNGDGLLLEGRTLYAVQNRLNQIAVVELDRAGTRGSVRRLITSPDFDVPTTVARWGNRLYLPNARFTTPPTPTTPYTVVAVRG